MATSGNDEKVDVPLQENAENGSGTEGAQQIDTDHPEPRDETKWLQEYFAKSLGISMAPDPVSRLESVDLAGIAKYMASDKCRKIVTMVGAGISTSAGIPDFRSPGTGLYDNLKKYNLPSPQSVFEISYFAENPEPFFMFRKGLWKGPFKPTLCHYFLKLLDKKGKLSQHFTQNIDALERVAGLDENKLVEAHGTINTGRCHKCSHPYTHQWMKEEILSESLVPKCQQKGCDGVVRPDIVFFGESLPEKFSKRLPYLDDCDLLIILGTSLVVQPFAAITNRVKDDVPRLYINLEKTGHESSHPLTVLMFGGGFAFDKEDNIRDVFWQGKCDDGCTALADLLGWGDELRNLVQTEHARLDQETKPSSDKAAAKTTTGLNKTTNEGVNTNISKGAAGLAKSIPSVSTSPRKAIKKDTKGSPTKSNGVKPTTCKSAKSTSKDKRK